MSLSKVLIISSEFPPNVGGIGNHGYNVATYLQKVGYTVTVLCDLIGIDKTTLQSFQLNNDFAIIPINRNQLLILSYLKRIILSVKYAQKADVIICSGKFSLWLVLIMKLFYSNKKYISVVHGSELLLYKTYLRLLTNKSLAKFNRIIAVSSFTKSLLSKNLQQNTSVIPNGVNNDEFIKYQSLDLVEVNLEDAINLITVGSVTERKGQENIIRALPAIIEQFPKIHYHIVGKPFLQNQLNKLVESLALQNYVTFYGAVSRDVLIETLNKSHIKLMLSNNTAEGDVEGFGIAILEANALGKPAIGSNDNGIKDAIVPQQTGALVNSKNTNEIVNAIREIIENYASYSKHAKQWAQQHDWNNIIASYILVINNS